jgi:multidrug efflux system membrane fusion protein
MKKRHRTKCFWIAALVFLTAAAGCSKQAAAPGPPPPVPVRVGKVLQKDVPVEVRAIGTAEAFSTVSIKPQISGQLEHVNFREGQYVRKGDVLFLIDRRPFEVALEQAEANLARDKARAANAHVQAARYTKLFQEGVTSQEQYDQARTDADVADAAVRADEAAVENAKLNLAYCTIAAPIDARTGSLMVHPGNLVKANDVPILVVLNQITPIYVNFALPEQQLSEVKKHLAMGNVRVLAEIPDQAGAPEQGRVSFVDNAVDDKTGTIRLKAAFDNRARRLWPGLYVNVVLALTIEPNAIVVPAPAVVAGQTGSFVYVVKQDNTVESRPVDTGRTINGETVIRKGLQPGETVVTDGQLRLFPGSRIQVKEN